MAKYPQNSSPASDQARSPWLFFAVIGVILAIFAFLLLRPTVSSTGTPPSSSPAAMTAK